MFEAWKKSLLTRAVRKLEVELGGCKSELSAIELQVKMKQSINYGQEQRMSQLVRRIGELHVKLEHANSDLRSVSVLLIDRVI